MKLKACYGLQGIVTRLYEIVLLRKLVLDPTVKNFIIAALIILLQGK